jgi:SAM-dependent methyltransferase
MSVFNSIYASQYDELYTEKNYTLECNLIEEAFRRYAGVKPNSVLDIGCGTGTHSLELAKRGYKMTGVDLSQSMIDIAKQKTIDYAGANKPHFLQGNATDFQSAKQHDAAIMMFAVIGYLTSNEDLVKGLKNIRSQLKTGATFICDFWYGPAVLTDRPTDRVRVIPSKDGQVIRAASTQIDTFNQTADVSFKLWTLKGEKLLSESKETHKMRYLFPQEIKLVANQCGFVVAKLSAFPDLDAQLDDTCWNALCVMTAN